MEGANGYDDWCNDLNQIERKKVKSTRKKHFPPSTHIALFEKSRPIELLGVEFARVYCSQSDRMLPSAHWIKANGYTLDLHYGRVTLIDLPANLTVSSSHVDELLGSFLNYGDSIYSNTLQIIADPSLSIWHCSRAIIPHNFIVTMIQIPNISQLAAAFMCVCVRIKNPAYSVDVTRQNMLNEQIMMS